METKILDGKIVAQYYKEKIKKRVSSLRAGQRAPVLAIILWGADKASLMYADFMKKTANDLGIEVVYTASQGDVRQAEANMLVQKFSADENIDGIIIMMPLPVQLDSQELIEYLAPQKDIDGLTVMNMGLLASGKEGFVPITARAVMTILSYYEISAAGKRVVVLGRSNVIGKPVALLLLAENATVTICHSQTKNIAELTCQADIIVAAVGKPNFLTADMVRPGAIIIDVGIHRIDGRTLGDVDYKNVAPLAGAITPVPGGVGSVTTMVLMDALVTSREKIC